MDTGSRAEPGERTNKVSGFGAIRSHLMGTNKSMDYVQDFWGRASVSARAQVMALMTLVPIEPDKNSMCEQ